MKGGARRRPITSDLRSPPQHPVQNEVNHQVNDQFEYGKQKRALEQQQSMNGGDYAGNEYDEEEKEDYDEDDDQSGDVDVDANGGERPKLAEGFYELETVRRKRIRKGETQYLIKWRGWPESANTWEPVENLKSCSDFIDAFEERSGKRKRKRKHSVDPTPQSKKKQKQPPHKPSVNIKTTQEPISIPSLNNSTFSTGTETTNTATTTTNGSGSHKFQEPKKKIKADQKLSSCTNQENTTDFTIHIQEDQVGNGTEVLRVSPRIGAKRRKSFAVKRFKQEPKMVTKNDVVVEDVMKNVGVMGDGFGCNEMKGISGNVSVVITKILKPVNYSTSILKGDEDVSVSFLVMRSDGEEVVVDNKYLKEHNPLLLINFYEQHLRYCSPSE